MRSIHASALAIAVALLIPLARSAQGQGDAARAVAGGGVSVPGGTGKIDAAEEKAGSTLNSAKLAGTPAALQVTTGPATAYWNPANGVDGLQSITLDTKAFVAEDKCQRPRGEFKIVQRDRG